MVTEATKNASLDLAHYMCLMLPVSGGTAVGGSDVDTTLAPPYAISYEVGAGIDNNKLVQGGRSSAKLTEDVVNEIGSDDEIKSVKPSELIAFR